MEWALMGFTWGEARILWHWGQVPRVHMVCLFVLHNGDKKQKPHQNAKLDIDWRHIWNLGGKKLTSIIINFDLRMQDSIMISQVYKYKNWEIKFRKRSYNLTYYFDFSRGKRVSVVFCFGREEVRLWMERTKLILGEFWGQVTNKCGVKAIDNHKKSCTYLGVFSNSVAQCSMHSWFLLSLSLLIWVNEWCGFWWVFTWS